MESKSIEAIVGIIEKKILSVLLSELPSPSCPRKKQQNDWKIDQVKKTLAARLGHPGLNDIRNDGIGTK
jgi:hypothetical protein